MSQHLKQVIDDLVSEIEAMEAEITPLKFTANTLARKLGIPEPFDEVSSGVPSGLRGPKKVLLTEWRIDQFFNRSLAGSVVEILEARKAAGQDGPASIEEIFTDLKAGGYKFEGSSGNEDNTKRAIKIALTKNTAQFVKLKDDVFSLKRWYASKTSRKPSHGRAPAESQDEIEEDASPDDATEETPSSVESASASPDEELKGAPMD